MLGRKQLPAPEDPVLEELKAQTELLRVIAEQQKNIIGGLRALAQRHDAMPEAARDLRTLVSASFLDVSGRLDLGGAGGGTPEHHREMEGLARTAFLEGVRGAMQRTSG